jgi:hypothetical protein
MPKADRVPSTPQCAASLTVKRESASGAAQLSSPPVIPTSPLAAFAGSRRRVYHCGPRFFAG